MFIINITELVLIIILIVIVLIGIVISKIKYFIDKKTKKDCYKCKYYKLYDVASVGDCCWYKCEKTDRKDRHSMNDKECFIKCNFFEQKESD